MKKNLINLLLLMYASVVIIIVSGLILLAFQYEFPYVFGFPLLGFFSGLKKVFTIITTLAQHEFPRFGILLVAMYNSCFIIGVITICNACFGKHFRSILKKSSSSLHQYVTKPFDKKQVYYTFIMLTIMFVFCLSVLEIGLRFAGVYEDISEKNGGSYISPYQSLRNTWFWNYSPNAERELVVPEFSQLAKTNSLGFVDCEWTLQKNDSIRIACIGDSFTEGIGAVSSASSYPSILRSMISNIEIMNWGIGGSDPVFGSKLFEQKVVDYHPNIVTLTVNESDFNEIVIRGGQERFCSDSTTKYRNLPAWEWLYGSCHIARLIAYQALGIDASLHIPRSHIDKESLYVNHVLKECIDTFNQKCLVNSVRPIIIFHPTQREVRSGHMKFEKVMRYAKYMGYEFIDILDYFQQHGMTPQNSGNYFWKFDIHNNSKGYELFAKGIYDYLMDTCHTSTVNVIGTQ